MKTGLIQKMKVVWLGHQDSRRLAQIPELMAQDLEVIASALRSGVGIIQAIQVASAEGTGVLAEEWALFLKDVRLGASIDAALRDLQARVPLAIMRSFATAVSITQTSGGNLAGILQTLAGTLRQEIIFQGKLVAMTAQGRLSGYVVGAMPFLLMVTLYLLSPELMRPFIFSGIGQLLLGVIVVMVAIGGWLIKMIVTIEV